MVTEMDGSYATGAIRVTGVSMALQDSCLSAPTLNPLVCCCNCALLGRMVEVRGRCQAAHSIPMKHL